jgi:hypothetical protein
MQRVEPQVGCGRSPRSPEWGCVNSGSPRTEETRPGHAQEIGRARVEIDTLTACVLDLRFRTDQSERRVRGQQRKVCGIRHVSVARFGGVL